MSNGVKAWTAAAATALAAIACESCSTVDVATRGASACPDDDARCIVREELKREESKRRSCRIVHGDDPILCP